MAEATSQINEKELKRYLYGEMAEDEVANIENKIFLDDNYFYDIANFENELIDQYVCKKLVGEELQRFEKSLKKSSERQAKVANAIALQTIIAEPRPVEKKVEETNLTLWESFKELFSQQTFAVTPLMTVGLLLVLILPLAMLVLLNSRSETPLIASNSTKTNAFGNKPTNSNVSGNNPKPDATTQPTANSTKKILLRPKVNYETTVENSVKEIEIVLILVDSEGSFTVQVNQNPSLNLSSKEMGNRKVINLYISTSNLVEGANKIIVKNTATNQNFEYNFTVRKK